MNTKRAVLACAFLALPMPAVAQEERFRRELSNTLGFAVNPLGLQAGADLTWRRALGASANPLLRDAHVSFGVAPRVTPAYARLGVFVQVAPLSILELRAGVEPSGYFGSFKSLLYFDGYSERFDNDARRERAALAAAGVAGRAFLSPTLKLRAGRVAFRSRAEFEWWRAQGKGAYFYEPSRDTLLRAAGDSLVTSETLLLYELRGGPRRLLLGPVHDLTWVSGARANRRQDVGVLAVWGLGHKTRGLRDASVSGKLLHYVEDPFKKGQFGAQFSIGFKLGRS
jgi:hypothetical protein